MAPTKQTQTCTPSSAARRTVRAASARIQRIVGRVRDAVRTSASDPTHADDARSTREGLYDEDAALINEADPFDDPVFDLLPRRTTETARLAFHWESSSPDEQIHHPLRLSFSGEDDQQPESPSPVSSVPTSQISALLASSGPWSESEEDEEESEPTSPTDDLFTDDPEPAWQKRSRNFRQWSNRQFDDALRRLELFGPDSVDDDEATTTRSLESGEGTPEEDSGMLADLPADWEERLAVFPGETTAPRSRREEEGEGEGVVRPDVDGWAQRLRWRRFSRRMPVARLVRNA